MNWRGQPERGERLGVRRNYDGTVIRGATWSGKNRGDTPRMGIGRHSADLALLHIAVD